MSRILCDFGGNPLMEAAKKTVSLLRGAGFQAYFAGGAVRDMLLGRAPADIDIATSARPEQVRSIFPETHDSGVAFGVVTVHLDGFQFETATFRSECGYADGRHPGKTAYTDSPEIDVSRRDFTVNGMMYDPLSGELLDFVGGREDLRRGIIRTIGDPVKRFSEDSLRILRAVRFHARFRFPIAPETETAARSLADRLHLLSAERIREELQSMLTGPDPRLAFRTLERIGALEAVLPEIHALAGVEQPPRFHPEGDVFEHTLVMLGKMAHPSPELAWSVLLHDVGKPPTFRVHSDGLIHFYGHEAVGARMAEEILRRLKCSTAMIRIVREAVADHMKFASVDKMKRSTLLRLIASPAFPVSLELHRIDCSSSHGKLGNYVLLLDVLKELADSPAVPPPLLNGGDLRELGMKPGPAMGRLLRELADLRMDGRISTREEALAEVLRRITPPGA